jgi:stearoyl-CoA 9-desaturase NADPH oxidoreductase
VMHVHYAPFADDVIFGAELERLGFEFPSYRYELIATREKNARRFDSREIERLVFDWRERETFACGPASLLDPIEARFSEQNASSKLHVERFRPKLVAVDPNASGGVVRFGLSKKDVETTAQRSLLEAAESAGITPQHGCRMGICHSCDVTMKSGCVRDLRTGETIQEPGARIQICVCAAAGDVEVDL